MTILFIILIVLASVILGFFVLVQNPKGGGLAGTFAGLGNQFMGVKQTTDVLEKGTWIFAGVVALLSLASTFFLSGTATATSAPASNATEATVPATTPNNNSAPFPTAPPATTPNNP